jgi:RimJ/RimL family protein N-acetyltransferase
MITLLPLLEGQHVRLEPLQRWHAPGLAEASAIDPSLYRWSPIPQGEAEATAYIETAQGERDAGVTAPFAVLRVRDDAVIGSTRLWDLGWWPWPEGHARHGHDGPDACEIGFTWLARPAIGTAANTEMKLLLLTHAFEVWETQSVCFHTDARNERSRAALERIGAQFEGVLRAHRLATDGRPRNSARYSITAPEWPGVKHHLQMLLAARERAELRL